MKNIHQSRFLRVAFEPRWPAIALGFYHGGSKGGHTFILMFSPLVIEIGKRGGHR
jgi:hypothetical protein